MDNISFLKKALLGAAFAGLAVTSFATQAAVINSLFSSGVNQIEDTDLERIVDASGAVKTSGNWAVGDTVQTILRFNTANVTTISDVYGAPYQLNAYAELQVAAVSAPDVNGVVNIAFAPTGNLGANVFVNLYERTSAAQPGFSQVLDPATAISNVTSETLIASLGIGQLNDFWGTTSLQDIGAAAGLAQGDPQQAAGIFGLSVLNNPGNLPILPLMILGADGNLHDVVGNASAYQLAPGANSGWLVSSNTSAGFTVPEPAPIALLGLGLAVMGLSMRRKKRV